MVLKIYLAFLGMVFLTNYPGVCKAATLHSNVFVRNLHGQEQYYLPTQKPVLLEAARNERVFFHFILDLQSSQQSPYSLSIKRETPSAKLFNNDNLNFYLLANCQDEYQDDCLIPLVNDKISFSSENTQPPRTSIWVECYVPENHPAGNFSQKFQIISKHQLISELRVNIKVFPFSLPKKPTLKVDLNNYGVGFVKDWGVQPGSEEASRIDKSVYAMAHTYRMTFNPLPYKSQRGRPHKTMAPTLAGSGPDIRVLDWTEYDKRYGPLFDGSFFEDGLPIDHQYLPFNPDWPANFSTYLNDRQRYEKEWQLIADEFITHFQEKGWNKSIFHVFLNQKPNSNNQIPWNLDEPKGVDDYTALRYYADLTHRVFQQNSNPEFKFRVDISHFYCDKHKGNIKKDFRINNGFNTLAPVDIWAISKHSLDGKIAQEWANVLKKDKKTVYEYFAGERMPLITDPLIKGIKYGWDAWLRKEDGIIFWNTVKNKRKNSAGRDFLLYPGVDYGIEAPIASVRFFAVLRGIQDYEYCSIASQYANITPLIEANLTSDPQDFQKLKGLLSSLIIQNMKKNN